VNAAGAGIAGTADGFYFASRSLSSDGQIVARLASLSAADGQARAGVIIRQGTAANAKHGFVGLLQSKVATFMSRATAGGPSPSQWTNGIAGPVWLKVVRTGGTLTGYRSADGVNWVAQGTAKVSTTTPVQIGLAVASHSKAARAKAVFDNVAVTAGAVGQPPPVPPPPPAPYAGLPAAMKSDDGFLPLFNGRDLTGFYPQVNGLPRGEDPDGYFRVEDGMLHVLGLPATSRTLPFGYLSTENSFTNYRLRFEYKWGTARFAPRTTAKRDSGVLLHTTGPERVWPTSLEVQVQEGDTGDFWLLEQPGGTVTVSTTVASTSTTLKQYAPGGAAYTQTNGRIVKSKTVDRLTDWNTVDVIVEGDSAVTMVNGVVVNRATNIKGPDGLPLTEGRIAFQAEGAEVWYRNVQVKPLFTTGTATGKYDLLVLAEPDASGQAPVAADAAAIDRLKFLGARNGFNVDVTVGGSGFTDANLSRYEAIAFLDTDGVTLLDDAAKGAFERYVAAGGGYVGIGSAPRTPVVEPPPVPPPPVPPPVDPGSGTDLGGDPGSGTPQDPVDPPPPPPPPPAAPAWPFIADLIGATADADVPAAKLSLSTGDRSVPATSSLPRTWAIREATEAFAADPPADARVLVRAGDDAGGSRPVSWQRSAAGGRAFYTSLGTSAGTWDDPLFLAHVLGGIEYAAGTSRAAPDGATVLFDGSAASTDRWQRRADGTPIGWTVADGALAVTPGTGDVRTADVFGSFRLHLEFNPNVKADSVAEQDRGNSGVGLAGSYELQVLDSYGRTLADKNDVGAIYGVRDASINAALPAGAWSSYDVLYTAPAWEGGTKVSAARVTAWLNGNLVQDDVPVPGPTFTFMPESPLGGPIVLQDHANVVRYRNVWLIER
ncbi:MAG TPA: family 16 glycoside hydrolase, partial [Humisphaera sp.]